MTNYNQCFLGITLPEKFQNEFSNLLTSLKNINQNLQLVEVKKLSPHITIQYLDTQSLETLSRIKQIVSNKVGLISNLTITISGMGYFKFNDPFVIFLEAKCPPELFKFQQDIKHNLADYLITLEHQEFHPHMTIARIPNEKSKQLFRDNKDRINDLLNQVKWSFKISELSIFGVNPNEDKNVHEQVFIISL